MTTEFKPDVLGTPGANLREVDPEEAIKKMEDELTEMARSLRQIRGDYVSGIVTEEEFVKIEAQFMDKLSEQRNTLQLLRSAAGKKPQ